MDKKSYFQGGGGENEPTPKKKKYKSEPALVMQPRFKEPLFKNYDIYDTPGEHSPGGGMYKDIGKYKSVKDFLEQKRKRNKNKYKSDDSWKQDDGTITKSPNKIKSRALLLNKIIKSATDFPIDEYFQNTTISNESDTSPGNANLTGGYLDKYLPENDFEEKPATTLDFGRDYTEELENNSLNNKEIQQIIDKYLNSTHGLYGLPDGVDLPDEDLNEPTGMNPDYGTTDYGRNIY